MKLEHEGLYVEVHLRRKKGNYKNKRKNNNSLRKITRRKAAYFSFKELIFEWFLTRISTGTTEDISIFLLKNNKQKIWHEATEEGRGHRAQQKQT